MCARSSWREANDCAHVGHWPMIFLLLDDGGNVDVFGVDCEGAVVCCVLKFVSAIVG